MFKTQINPRLMACVGAGSFVLIHFLPLGLIHSPGNFFQVVKQDRLNILIPCSSNSPKLNGSQFLQKQVRSLSQLNSAKSVTSQAIKILKLTC
jgi:hypothetical protein